MSGVANCFRRQPLPPSPLPFKKASLDLTVTFSIHSYQCAYAYVHSTIFPILKNKKVFSQISWDFQKLHISKGGGKLL